MQIFRLCMACVSRCLCVCVCVCGCDQYRTNHFQSNGACPAFLHIDNDLYFYGLAFDTDLICRYLVMMANIMATKYDILYAISISILHLTFDHFKSHDQFNHISTENISEKCC